MKVLPPLDLIYDQVGASRNRQGRLREAEAYLAREMKFFERYAHGVPEAASPLKELRLPHGITLTEIPLAQRSPEMPLRFQPTVAGGGLPTWEIRYQSGKLDET